MSRVCTVCSHPDRAAIDAALVVGTPYRSIAKQFGASPQAVLRHKQDHVPERLAQAHQAGEVADADNLLRQVRGLQAKAVAILLRAERDGDLRTALAAIREARGCLELLAKLLGELDERPVVNLVVAPEWVMFRTVLIQALAPFPDARAAAAKALLAAERNGNGGNTHAAPH